MYTYTIQQLDDLSVHHLPMSIISLDQAIDYAKEHYSDLEQVRVCEHYWDNVSTTPYLVDTYKPKHFIMSLSNYFNPKESDISIVWEMEDEKGNKYLKVPIWMSKRDQNPTQLCVDDIDTDTDFFRECLIGTYSKRLTERERRLIDQADSPIGLWAKQVIYRDRQELKGSK